MRFLNRRNARESRRQDDPKSGLMELGDTIAEGTDPASLSKVSAFDSTPPVTWSVDYLNDLGPAKGPSHRAFVPVVRSGLTGIENTSEPRSLS